MHRLVVLLFVLVFLTRIANGQVDPSGSGDKEVIAVFADEAPKLDGILDDPIWQQIDPIVDWVQRVPNEGASPTERSEMRIAYDENNLYFAFHFFDSEPEKIRANYLNRGGRLHRDDHIWLMLDTYHDKRNAYLFEITAAGTQDDAIINDESLSIDDFKWDGIFTTETNIDEYGWTLEVGIPFRTLRFSKDEEPLMGLAIERRINRKNERVIWPFIPLRFRSGILQVSQYATLRGMRGLKRGRNIEIKPYILTGAQELRTDESEIESDIVRDVGLDVKIGLTSNLTVDLTANTDFAQVESDDIQLNLTRFGLFIPEKREFFLERIGLFEFGDQKRTETFFSRTIGITNEILAGARLTGQIGPVSIGFLNIQTKKDDDFDLPGSNNLVARVRTDVAPRTTIGGIVTNFEQGEAFNRAVGVDGVSRFWGSSQIRGWFTNVWDDEYGSSNGAGAASITLRNDLLSTDVSYTNVSSDFRPKLGFVRRRDMIAYSINSSLSPRFTRDESAIRQISFSALGSVTTGQDHHKQSSRVSSGARISFHSGERIDLQVGRGFEQLDDSFNIRPETEILAGEYVSDNVTLGVNTYDGRKFWMHSKASYSEFFGGTRIDLSGTLAQGWSKYFKTELRFNHSIIDLPVESGEFDATTLTLVLFGATSRKLFANALIQYDNFSNDVQANIRVNWIHTPGSDLFVVFSTSYNFSGDENQFDPRSAILNDRVGVAKVTYLVMI
ncbi:MAG: carbohydrate binding family 9 domain-containing protein [Bacteroidetes bacterium]|nr:carbohydrate binding family 9 domain-containing protein [Bacteroidota bacterium]